MSQPPLPAAGQPVPTSPNRRRVRRQRPRLTAEGRAALLARLLQHVYPSYEFFLFALTSGAVLGLGYLLDAPALLLFGALLAPFLSPWTGMVFATVSGGARVFVQAALALLMGAVFFFLTGMLSGLAGRLFMPLPLAQLALHTRLWWPDLLVLAFGAMLTAISYVRSEQKPLLPGVILSYELFLPLTASGFAVGLGLPNTWQDGLLVTLLHLCWALLFGVLPLAFMGFRPRGFMRHLAALSLTVGALTVVLALGGPGAFAAPAAPVPSPTAGGPLAPPPALATSTPTFTPAPSPTITLTPSITPTFAIPPTETPSPTLTPQPTPVYARIYSPLYGGAAMRDTPDGKVIATLDNGYLIEVRPDLQVYKGYTWSHVVAVIDGRVYDGWVLQSVVQTATPVPGW